MKEEIGCVLKEDIGWILSPTPMSPQLSEDDEAEAGMPPSILSPRAHRYAA
jgi:hypothetical protein